MPYRTSTYNVEYKSGGTWTAIADSAIIDVSGDALIQGSEANLAAFGDSITRSVQIRTRVFVANQMADKTPIRISYSFNGGAFERVFTGFVKSKSRNLNDATINCVTVQEIIAQSRADSPAFFRRPVATRTTVSSVEDPSSGSYQAGMINWLLWQAGGRPAPQDFNYPTATFYYSCDPAPLAPEWSWAAGENSWTEILTLARASGGMVRVDADGTVRYVSPYQFASGASVQSIGMSDFGSISETVEMFTSVATAVECTYVPRVARALQEVINDNQARLIRPGGTITFDLTPQNPLKSLETVNNLAASDAFVMTYFDGEIAARHSSTGYSHSLTIYAQRVSIGITNNTSRAMVLHKVVMRGEPIAPSEQQTVTVGAGAVKTTIADNPYIQSLSHARRLATLLLRFLANSRAVRTISEMAWNGPAVATPLAVGAIVTLSVDTNNFELTNVQHVITSLKHSETGGKMELTVVDTSNFPKVDDYYIINTVYNSSTTKRLSI